MKKYLFCSLAILLIAVGCDKISAPIPQTTLQHNNSNPEPKQTQTQPKDEQKPVSAADPKQEVSTPASDNEYILAVKKEIQKQVSDFEQKNVEFSQTTLKTYSGLPQPAEDDKTIQVYAEFMKSLSGANSMFQLTTYSKSVGDFNDFGGELGDKGQTFYLCSNSSFVCNQTDIITRAQQAGQPGYMSLGYCLLGWDDVNKKIYSFLCGEGADGSQFGEFKYDTNESYLVGQRGQLYFLRINKQLTYFAMQKMSNNQTIGIEVRKTNDPTKIYKTIDFAQLNNIDLNIPDVLKFEWDNQNETIAHFIYQKHNFVLNAETGEVTQE